MKAKVSLSDRALQFAVVPLYLPKGEYIAAVEEECLKLPPKVAEKCNAEFSKSKLNDCHLKHNIAEEEVIALKELKQGKSSIILTVDKGVAVVVLDKQVYINKAWDPLAQRDTYRALTHTTF